MKSSINKRRTDTESELDLVLTNFFEAELPPTLPPLPANMQHTIKRSGRRFRVMRIAGCMLAATLVVVASIVLRAFERRLPDATPLQDVGALQSANLAQSMYSGRDVPLGTSAVAQIGSVHDGRDNAVRTASNPALLDSVLAYYQVADALPIERRIYQGRDARYQQLARVNWTRVAVVEPSTGDWVGWTIPQLDIEVVPVSGFEWEEK